MPSRWWCALLLFSMTSLPQIAVGETKSPAAPAVAERVRATISLPRLIDDLLGKQLAKQKITPAALVDDATLVRRTTLDLAGRIPTVAEVQGYLASNDPAKREQLVDRLLASADFPFHHANELDRMILAENRADGNWLKYLREAASEDRPWGVMFRQMMSGDQSKEPEKFALTFLKKRAKSADDMTNDTSRLFFGVSVNCAQCHDHPLVEDWKQDHYFGFKTFFDRTFLTKADRLAEKYRGEVKFKTTEGVEKTAAFMFLTGATVAEPEDKTSKEERKKQDEQIKKAMKDKKAAALKPPAFSPRGEFVKLALTEENRHFFTRNIVNRVWARFLGRGLVHPLDQMHSENPASHPELLDALAADLVANGYRLKRLMRGIVLSDAYARSSRWTEGEPPAPEDFALMPPRILTPRQYGLSLIIATSNPETIKPAGADWQKRREQFENASHGIANLLELPTEHFQVSVDEALLFSNSDRVQNDYLRDSGDKLVGVLKKEEDTGKLVRQAYTAVLSREPDESELAAVRDYLEGREQRDEGIRQVVWALITSPEMRFNH